MHFVCTGTEFWCQSDRRLQCRLWVRGGQYIPVCSHGITYFSACYAGCTNTTVNPSTGDIVYTSCVCSAADPAAITQALRNASAATAQTLMAPFTAIDGSCLLVGDSSCSTLPAFLGLLFVAMALIFANGAPATLIQLRVLSPQYRSFGQGLANVMLRFFGMCHFFWFHLFQAFFSRGCCFLTVQVAFPVLCCSVWPSTGAFHDSCVGIRRLISAHFLFLFRSVCVFWNEDCGRRGDCYEYNNWNLQMQLLILAIVPKGSCLCVYSACVRGSHFCSV